MKCANCGHENPIKANFCSSCGHRFTEEDRKNAYEKTVYHKLDKLKDAKEWITLSKITSNPVFRALVLLVVIAAGVLSHSNKGTDMTVLEDESYTVRYNTKLEEYYLFTGRETVHVGLYAPGVPEEFSVQICDRDGAVLETQDYSVDDEIVLKKDQKLTYVITARYEKGEKKIALAVLDSSLAS